MFNFNFLKQMTKKRFNFRNVVAIAICLAGVTMFSGCNKEEPEEESTITYTGGNLVLEDGYAWIGGLVATNNNTTGYIFKADGTYQYLEARTVAGKTEWIDRLSFGGRWAVEGNVLGYRPKNSSETTSWYYTATNNTLKWGVPAMVFNNFTKTKVTISGAY